MHVIHVLTRVVQVLQGETQGRQNRKVELMVAGTVIPEGQGKKHLFIY